ncbi:MAG: tetratricopeptide repeat protein [Anaerolineae bacterium]|nr:tetratricopeptide repeat protein [Anaerolineae bacterium]
MAKTSSGKSKAKDKSQISIGGDLAGNNNVVGSNNVVTNIYSPENIKLNALHQLPPAPADFTGRAELISQLLSDFNVHKGATISGLTGMGGIGKTALGLEVANKIKDQYQDAQIFLDLKGTTAPLSALDIARHVILSFEPKADLRGLNESNMQAEYLSVLHEKKALLFFDNARSAEQIAPLRPPADCAMLVTSRWTFPVTGLQAHRVDVLSEVDAVNFLLELCPRIADKAADLAKACAYLPLALRIAGSFLLVNSDWSVEKYLSKLSDRKKRLETLKQSRTNAELTTEPDLLATFELSYNALTAEDRKHWRMLGVFPASFAGNAVQAMRALDENEASTLLGVLRRYSLLDYDETNSRYSLHDLLADYALAQMEGEEEQESRIAHVSYYMEVMEVADSLYKEGSEKILSGLKLFDQEWEHIRFAQAWAFKNIKASKRIAEFVMLYPDTSVYCLDLRLAPKQKIIWFQAAAEAAKQLHRKDALGVHLGNLGLAYAALGEVQKAIEFYEQALVIAREIGDRRNEGSWLGNLGLAYADLGEVQKAIEFYEQALVIKRKIGDRRSSGAALGNLGLAYAALGEVQKAIEFYEQALVIHREIGDRRSSGAALGNLGNAYAALGEVKKAIEFYEQALVIHREIGDRRNEGNWLGNLGIAYKNLGEVKKAIEFHEQALVIDREIGDRRGEGADLGNLGNTYADLGEVKKAIEFYEQALVIDREIGNRHGEGAVLGNLGVAYADLGEVQKTIEFNEQQLVIVREIGDRYGEGNALFNMGLAWHGLEEKDKAIALMKQALVIYEAIESPSAEDARNVLKEWGA